MIYTRPQGDTRFRTLSGKRSPLPSGEFDNEFTLLAAQVNLGFPKDNSELLSGSFNLKKGGDVASSASLALGRGNYFDITGSNAITSIATKGIGTKIKLHFDGTLLLTHHATNLVLPDNLNILTYPGSEITLVEYDTAQWRMVATNAEKYLSRQIENVIVSDTLDETNLYSYTVPANLLSTNRGLRMKTYWTMLNNGGGVSNFIFRAYYGSTVIMYRLEPVGGPLNATYAGHTDITLFANNATGAQVARALWGYFDNVPTSVAGVMSVEYNDAMRGCVHNAVAEDSTGALPFKLTLEHSVAHADKNVTLLNGTVELI